MIQSLVLGSGISSRQVSKRVPPLPTPEYGSARGPSVKDFAALPQTRIDTGGVLLDLRGALRGFRWFHAHPNRHRGDSV